MNYLVTGGTGSFGKEFIKNLIADKDVKKIIIYSRDELKQFELQNIIRSERLEFVLGDVRDYYRLKEVSTGVDVVVHAAAMKQIPASEMNPSEAIRTNIGGAENIIRAAVENKVPKVLALSTDKAANPANLYGATKLCSDKLFVAANSVTSKITTKFSVVRYGNVLGSRGSVIPFFQEKAQLNEIPITHPDMTRFWISLEQGVNFVKNRLNDMKGGEIFVPKIPSFKVVDVAKIVAPGVKHKIIGIRPGEKLHETMITEHDSFHTLEYSDYYAIVPVDKLKSFQSETSGIPVKVGFTYSSDTNSDWFTEKSFTEILKLNQLL